MQPCERRQTNRYVMRIPLNFQELATARPVLHFGKIVNVSSSGICFSTDAAPKVGTSLGIFLKVPEEVIGKPSPSWHWIGQVIYVRPGSAPEEVACVGVHFIGFEPC